MKHWIRKIHLWLGFTSGAIVLLLSVTGCLIVFQKEISECIYKNTMFVAAPQDAEALPISTLLTNAQQYLGKEKAIGSITTYQDPERAWEFSTFKGNNTAVTYFGNVVYYDVVYINPYTGTVTGSIDYKHNFFTIAKYLHWSLLLNTKYGQPIVGWATLIFVITLITGLVLWYPKRWDKVARKNRFTLSWKSKFKRFNYDLHNVLGFYVALVAIVIALTGMVWAFSWFKSAVYTVASGGAERTKQEQLTSIYPDSTTVVPPLPLDVAYRTALLEKPDAKRFSVSLPYNDKAMLQISAYKFNDCYYSLTDIQFDQYTAQLLSKQNSEDKNRGERLLDMNYDIHVGSIGGIVGKIIVFFAALICGSLPVTGFYIWWHKRRKKRTGL